MQPRHTNSIITALVFALFGVIWIFFTDRLFLKIAGDDIGLYLSFQNWKGLLFVLLAALLVFLVSSRLNKRLDKANYELQRNNSELKKLYQQTLQQDNALKDAYERFTLLSQATGDAIWEYNFIDRTSYANDALKQLFGYTSDELKDNFTWWTSNLHPDDKLRVISRTETALSGKETVWFDEYRFRAKDGSYKTIYDRGYILRDDKGRPLRLIGAMQDVTLQRRLQQELIGEKVAHQKEIAQATIQVQEAERKQLGEELHDNINQLLATTKLYLDHALANPPEMHDFVRKSLLNINDIIEEIRTLSRSLAPPSLGDLGLEEALYELITTVGKTGDLKFTLNINEITDDGVSKDKKLAIYRVVQEQLNNILKHAGASKVLITLEKTGDDLVLQVSDNGRGFDPLKVRYGVGLRNIRNRAELYGGQIELQSAPDKGCTLIMRIHI